MAYICACRYDTIFLLMCTTAMISVKRGHNVVSTQSRRRGQEWEVMGLTVEAPPALILQYPWLPQRAEIRPIVITRKA